MIRNSFVLLITLLANVTFAGNVECERTIPKVIEESHEISKLAEYIDGAEFYAQQGDTRKVRSSNSPKWLEAVGKLEIHKVGGREKYNCTVILVGNGEEIASRIALTNSHCIDHLYPHGRSRFSKKSEVRLTSNSGKVIINSIVDILGDGRPNTNGSGHDYAVVLLAFEVDVNDITPLQILIDELPSDYKEGLKEYAKDSDDEEEKRLYKEFADSIVETIAGYSGNQDEHLGNGGENLTYDDNCKSGKIVKNDEEHNDSFVANGCFAYRGASGGAYVMSYIDEFTEERVHHLVGLNMGTSGKKLSNGEHDRSTRRIVPVNNFSSDLIKNIRMYNSF